MRGAHKRGLWVAPSRSARFIAGRRFPFHSYLSRKPPRQDFHTSTTASSALRPHPWGGTGSVDPDLAKALGLHHAGDPVFIPRTEQSSVPTILSDVLSAQEVAEQDILNAPSPVLWSETFQKETNGRDHATTNDEATGKKEGTRSRTPGTRRSLRSRRQKGIPPVKLPVWFLERNVSLNRPGYNELQPGPLEVISNPDEWIRTTDFYDVQTLLTSSLIEQNFRSRTEGALESRAVEQIEAFASCLGQCVKILERIGTLEELKLDQAEEESLLATASSMLEELHRRIRLARAEGLIESVLPVLRDRFPDFEEEIEEFRESERIGKQTADMIGQADVFIHKIHSLQLSELKAYMAKALDLPKETPGKVGVSNAFPLSRAHIKLLCPIDGSDLFVEKLVENCASQLNADLIKLDSQDLAELGGEYLEEGSPANAISLWNLSYDTTQAYNSTREQEEEDEEEEAEEEEEEDFDVKEFDTGFHHESALPAGFSAAGAIPIMNVSGTNLRDALRKLLRRGGLANIEQSGKSGSQGGFHGLPTIPGGDSRQLMDIKLAALLDTILDSNHIKHLREVLTAQSLIGRIQKKIQSHTDRPKKYQISYQSYGDELSLLPDTLPNLETANRPATVVLLRGLNEMRSSVTGVRVLDKLVEAVRKRRNAGEPIVIVGTTASSNIMSRMSEEGLVELQAEDSDLNFRPLVVTPVTDSRTRPAFYRESREKIMKINTRHLYSLLKRYMPRVGPKLSLQEFRQDMQSALLSMPLLSDKLSDRVLTLDNVHRIIVAALGSIGDTQSRAIDEHRSMGAHVGSTMHLLAESDNVKAQWMKNGQQYFPAPIGVFTGSMKKPPHMTFGTEANDSLTRGKTSEQHEEEAARKLVADFDNRLARILKTCTPHEKTLSKGIINPHNIKTTFADVHAPSETIEALKTLTTLSLKRPDAFKYGVLADDKISGVLLYGPPGTGKTLLARAVAKETGSTVLEVSGSDVFEMYVGEGEKKVRAVFNLAKKLSPCIVFIDEADAIFASRGTERRNSHRELVNQFLREMDGMIKTTAFIMVATNRPFDLDDAALRRFPRRLLVDLPDEKDREAILRIHLRGEIVEPSVSITQLASQTQLYSGSDLKNLVVAAALGAVREENEIADQHTGDEPYKHREKRILTQQHFDRAMEEISASVNEDMGSLKAIKKFDEKYGDRRGRRKKTVYGFSTGLGKEDKEEAVKVRS